METMHELKMVSRICRLLYDDLLHALIAERNRIENTSADTLAKQPQPVDTWWAKGIQWDMFLDHVLGPRRDNSTTR